MNLVNSIPAPSGVQQLPGTTAAAPKTPEIKSDTVELSTKEVKPPKIGALRILFRYLKQDQIDAINETKRLPKNAKFIGAPGGYALFINWFNIVSGTTKLPDTHEVKRDFLGFTIVVPKETKSIFIRKTPAEKAEKLALKQQKKAEKAAAKAAK